LIGKQHSQNMYIVVCYKSLQYQHQSDIDKMSQNSFEISYLYTARLQDNKRPKCEIMSCLKSETVQRRQTRYTRRSLIALIRMQALH